MGLKFQDGVILEAHNLVGAGADGFLRMGQPAFGGAVALLRIDFRAIARNASDQRGIGLRGDEPHGHVIDLLHMDTSAVGDRSA